MTNTALIAFHTAQKGYQRILYTWPSDVADFLCPPLHPPARLASRRNPIPSSFHGLSPRQDAQSLSTRTSNAPPTHSPPLVRPRSHHSDHGHRAKLCASDGRRGIRSGLPYRPQSRPAAHRCLFRYRSSCGCATYAVPAARPLVGAGSGLYRLGAGLLAGNVGLLAHVANAPKEPTVLPPQVAKAA